MTRVHTQTPSRLHFGLLSWGPDSPRQFGGVGLMIDAPGVELTATPAPHWRAEGPLAGRALRVAEQVADRLTREGAEVSPAQFQIHRAPREHVGLGVGTQLSLAVAEAITALAGEPDPSTSRLAELAGRGLRSGIGLHGYRHGGFLVDGGRRGADGPPPLLSRLPFPEDWTVVVVIPDRSSGLHGREELHAFAELPPIPERLTDRLCRLVLLGLMPTLVERDLPSFGAALTELQSHVGACFAPAQGGLFARPTSAAIVTELRAEGLQGVGQSSWGPTLYGFLDGSSAPPRTLIERLRERLRLGPASVFATQASTTGRAMRT